MDIDINTIDSLLNIYPSLKRIPDKDRVKCSWTQHEMPARVDAIEKYIQGKKYQQLLKKNLDNNSLEKFQEFLEPSTKKNHENQLFCKLTLKHLNKEPHHILKHVQGKKFQRAYVKWQECQSNGTEYVPGGRKKKKPTTAAKNPEDDDEYVDLSDDEIVIEDDDEDDLADLYPNFRRLRASDVKARAAKNQAEEEEKPIGTKRKADKSQNKKPKKLAAPTTKRMRSSNENSSAGNTLVKPTKTMTITI